MKQANKDYLKYLNTEITCESGKKYTITKYISEGGNGFVFECENSKKTVYVLKLLHTTKDVKIANFKKEIVLQKQICSNYIVKCIDSGEQLFGKNTKPRPFYIMEKYDSSLENLIDDNQITPTRAYKYILQLCEGLKTMHGQKEPIIHRDLKPENILYDIKQDRVLICDFGLAHLDNKNNSSINEGFVGNIDYHAPEQKKRGKQNVGTYTDIYSLGLIINVLFTNEIAQGEKYKKIWQCVPYFSFLDEIVERMIRHDISTREHDINSVILELEEHEFQYEVEESFVKNMYKKVGLPADKASELINLFSLMEFMLKHNLSWNDINLNYLCDYHFKCTEVMIDSLLLSSIFDLVKDKFEYEGNVYNGTEIPYSSINIEMKKDKKYYISFVDTIDKLNTFKELLNKKNIAKKYFASLCGYHCNEILRDIEKLKQEINENCLDAPALYITNYISRKLPFFPDWEYSITNCVFLIKYETSDVIDKKEFSYDRNKDIKLLIGKIKNSFPSNSHLFKDDGAKLWFDSLNDEIMFENFLKKIARRYDKNDVRYQDVLDIINGIDSATLKKIYKIDRYTAKLLLEHVDMFSH